MRVAIVAACGVIDAMTGGSATEVGLVVIFAAVWMALLGDAR